jgi:hypothetical protein
MSSDPPNTDHLNDDTSESLGKRVQQSFRSFIRSLCFCDRTPAINLTLINKPDIHSSNYLCADRYKYSDDGGTAQCSGCEPDVSQWPTSMDPLITHGKESPRCSFAPTVQLTQPTSIFSRSSSSTFSRHLSIQNEHENSSQHRGATANMVNSLNTLFEANSLQEVRKRTFSHWPYRTSPPSEQMIEAGFFGCNTGDRVICIYCDLICQQWTPHTDDPCEVHKTLSPNCIYVKSKLTRRELPPIINANTSLTKAATGNHSPTTNNLDRLQSNEIAYTASDNLTYTRITERCASFATWPRDNLASIKDLAQSGFFYTGINTVVTCFYCNGSLQNWGLYDNPMVEHALWYPHCAYAKQWCGYDLYRELQQAKRARQGIVKHDKILSLLFNFISRTCWSE